jgi:hypothetical protein
MPWKQSTLRGWRHAQQHQQHREQGHRVADRQAGRQAQAGRHRQAGTGRQAQAGRQTGRQAGSQPGRQTDRLAVGFPAQGLVGSVSLRLEPSAHSGWGSLTLWSACMTWVSSTGHSCNTRPMELLIAFCCYCLSCVTAGCKASPSGSRTWRLPQAHWPLPLATTQQFCHWVSDHCCLSLLLLSSCQHCWLLLPPASGCLPCCSRQRLQVRASQLLMLLLPGAACMSVLACLERQHAVTGDAAHPEQGCPAHQ